MASIIIELRGPVVAMNRRAAISSAGKPYQYMPTRAKSYQADLRLAAHKAMGGEPPLAGPIMMQVWITLPIPASWTKKKQADAAAGRIHPAKKPDIDNLWKAIADPLSLIVFGDDAQIVEAHGYKQYGYIPGLRVEVEEIADD